MVTKTLKHSRQREALIDILRNTKCHPSANWLYQEMRKSFPNISLATVYRNLNLLLETNQIIRLDVGSGTEHYDGDTSAHYHFVCKCCDRILDLELPPLDELDREAERLNGVLVEGHSLLYYGVCKNCQKAEAL